VRIGVLGATGAVGYWILQLLEERGRIDSQDVFALTSSKSAGKEVSFGDHVIRTQSAQAFDFSQIDLLFSAVEADVAADIIPRALDEGVHVVDKSSAFRLREDVPLIVPEVNGDVLSSEPALVASPNCVVIPLVVALTPLHEESPIENVYVSTYQSVSGAGRRGMDALYQEVRKALSTETPENDIFSKQIAFNVIPEIDPSGKDGFTGEEEKIIAETRKILGQDLHVCATAVRVPVFVGHALSVMLKFHDPVSLQTAKYVLSGAPGLSLQDGEQRVTTPLECVGKDHVFLSRLRQVPDDPRSLTFWLVCDNLRKGAALNAVQIAERLMPT
jgi:aspartate-semialdehyde dehydrogenase